MKFSDYLKDKLLYIIIYLLSLLLITIMLFTFNVNSYLISLIIIINILTMICIGVISYYRKKNFYNNIINNLNKLDKKFYILETIPNPSTYEEKIMVDILYDINKSMIENINVVKNNIKDYKEFVELWIHEVKIPIASFVLKGHNNKYSSEFMNEVNKLDNYIDQVLYYIRSENTEKDFMIVETNLKDLVRNVTIKNKDSLLDNKIDININVPNINVNTDSKWMEFVINQIINNSIKYKKDKDSFINIDCIEENNLVTLVIKDNGIGIPSKDINRVFDKSFTGSNGRNKIKSTGMGLYIVKNLVNKLGHQIFIESVLDESTTVKIIFKNNEYYKNVR